MAVRDKDGISALVRILALAADLGVQGKTLRDRLDDIERRFGVHATDQLSVRVTDLAVIGEAIRRLRTSPPAMLAEEPVHYTDLAEGSPDLPPTDGVVLAGETVRVVVRPSGTEPKLKAYLEARCTPEDSQNLTTGRAQARHTLRRLRTEVAAALGLPA